MVEKATLKTYSPGNPVRLELELEDASGVARVAASFVHKEDSNMSIRMEGDGEGQRKARVVLEGAVTESTAPGEYYCAWIYVSDVNGRHTTTSPRYDLAFLVHNELGDYDPPEIKDVRLK